MEELFYSFEIDCLPPSVNHIWRSISRGGKPIFYKDPKAKEFTKIAALQIPGMHDPIEGDVELQVLFQFKSEKRMAGRDLDNMLKMTCDLLTEKRILLDDSQIVSIKCSKVLGDSDKITGKLLCPLCHGTGVYKWEAINTEGDDMNQHEEPCLCQNNCEGLAADHRN